MRECLAPWGITLADRYPLFGQTAWCVPIENTDCEIPVAPLYIEMNGTPFRLGA